MKTKTHLVIIASVLFLLGSIPAGGALEQQTPGDSLVYMHWSGRSLTFDGSLFGQAVQQGGVAELLGFVREAIEKNAPSPKDKETFGRVWNMLGIAWQRPMAAALTNIDKGGPSAVLLIDLGKEKEAFGRELDAALALMGEPTPAVQVGKKSYRPFPSKAGKELAFGYMGNVFFITAGKGQAKALLELTPAGSLGANKKFTECIQAVGGKNEQIVIYADVAGILKKVERIEMGEQDPAEKPAPAKAVAETRPASKVRTIAEALGANNIQALAGIVRIVDKGMYTKVRLFSPAPHRGLLMPLAGAKLTAADLAGVPEDADFVMAVNISAGGFYEEILDMLRRIEGSDKMLVAASGALGAMLDVSLEKDIFPALGDTWVLSMADSQGGLLVGTMLTVEVRDEKMLAAAIAKMEAAAGRMLAPPAPRTMPASGPARPRRKTSVSIQTVKVGETEIHYLRTTAKGAGMAFMPAWAVHNKRLYLAVWPQVIASALENKTAALSASAQFKALRARVSPDASWLIYVNSPAIAEKLYPLYLIGGTVLTNMLAGQADGGDKPMPLWPGSLASVTRFLRPELSAVSCDKDGITFEGYSSGPSTAAMAPAAVGLGAAVLLPMRTVSAPYVTDLVETKAKPKAAPKAKAKSAE